MMTVEDQRWGRAIRRRLEAWKWTQQRMADHLEESPQRINDWVKFRRVPNDTAKAKLVQRLMIDPFEVAPDYLRVALERNAPVPPAPSSEVAA